MEGVLEIEGALPEPQVEVVAVANAPKFKEPPEDEPLAKKWQKRIEKARNDGKWKKFLKRIKHNRDLVAGFNWDKDSNAADSTFLQHRANLIQGTITGVLPNLYAQNPEVSVSPVAPNPKLKLFCKTLETVVNRYLDQADMKDRAKASVRAALTCSYGIVKVLWQQDIERDPIIEKRIQDAQDNLKHVERLLMELQDESARAEQEAVKAELEQTIAALTQQVEVVKAEGLVIDRILTEHLLVDPSVKEFSDYVDADWICHIVPMRRDLAEGMYGYKLTRATSYHEESKKQNNGHFAGGIDLSGDEDAQVAIYEIWDKTTQRVYTLAEGCNWFLREPYSPENVGERWYPFFLLPYQLVDGTFIAPSLVDLTERLQDEHNRTRDKLNEHRNLMKPGYITSDDVDKDSIERFVDAEMGEITRLKKVDGDLSRVIMPKQFPPIDPAAYDVGQVRIDWEMVTGLQDAARSTVVKPKTATEANIMQQQLSARVSAFRDQIEQWIQQVAQYTAEILLLSVDEAQVAKICGENEMGVNQATGQMVVVKQVYDWLPGLPRDDVFDLVQLRIRAGTTGAPDKLEGQEMWLKLLQIIQPMITSIMQMQAQGHEPTALINLVKETVSRFDDRIEVEDFLPSMQQMMAETQAMQQQQMALQAAQQQQAQMAQAQQQMIGQ